MEDVAGAGALVEVVDVLCDDIDPEVLLELDDGAVAGVGLCLDQVVAALVVEAVDEGGVAGEAVGGGHVHDGIFFPQAAGVAEGGDAALGAHAGARGDY